MDTASCGTLFMNCFLMNMLSTNVYLTEKHAAYTKLVQSLGISNTTVPPYTMVISIIW